MKGRSLTHGGAHHLLIVLLSADPCWQPDSVVPITLNLYFLPLSNPVTRIVVLGQPPEAVSLVTVAVLLLTL